MNELVVDDLTDPEADEAAYTQWLRPCI